MKQRKLKKLKLKVPSAKRIPKIHSKKPKPTSYENAKSPIEEMFYAEASKQGIKLERQVKIGRYFADFVYREENFKITIECDGYRFHSSKEQRNKDAMRERFIQRQGYFLTRYTGTQIYHNVWGCIREFKELIEMMRERYN